jgi:hypothetical protein
MDTRRYPAFDHTDSSLEDSLEEEGLLPEVDAVAVKRVMDWQLDDAAQADAQEGIRQGLEDAGAGRLRPVREFFAEFEAAHPELGQRMRNRPRTA